jgi:hypothetical protein
VSHGLLQDAINYRPAPARLEAVFQRIQGAFPAAPRGKKKEWQEHVAAALTCRAQATIASGDKLLRDPGKLREVQHDIHGKVAVGEMEAAGLVEACRLQGVPWLVIRGISDFGDELKDDRFHALASRAAAAVMADFIAHGLDLGKAEAQVAQADSAEKRKSLFVVGLPIAREQDFFGRAREKGEILDAIGKGLPAQILGGAKVGKSSLLRWVERHVPAGRPMAWIEPGAGFSPGMLVAAIARKVNKPEVAARVEREGATLRAAGRVRAGSGEDDLREKLNDLRDRKLLVKSDGAYGLPPGEAWRKFVQNAG